MESDHAHERSPHAGDHIDGRVVRHAHVAAGRSACRNAAGVASLAEAKAICEQDLAACKRDASEDRPTSPRGRKLDQHRRLLLAAPLRMAGNAREGVSLDLLLEVVEHEFHIEVPLSGQGPSTQWSRSPN